MFQPLAPGGAVRLRRRRAVREARRRQLAVVIVIGVVARGDAPRDRVRRRRPSRCAAIRAGERVAPLAGGTADAAGDLAHRPASPPAPDQPKPASPQSDTPAARTARCRLRLSARRRTKDCSSASGTALSAAGAARRAGTSYRAALGPPPRRSMSARRREPTSTRPVDGTIVGIGKVVLNGRSVRAADRHPALRRAVARRLGVAARRRSVTRGRRFGHRLGVEARPRPRLLEGRAAGARAPHERRREPRPARGPHGSDAASSLKIFFVADVFGSPGRRAVESRLPGLRDELGVDFCIVNGENAADGRGITAKIAERLLASGADVVTLGNWAWGQPGFAPYLSGTDRVLRPANMSSASPGRGLAVHDGVAVINLLGELLAEPVRKPVRGCRPSRRGSPP